MSTHVTFEAQEKENNNGSEIQISRELSYLPCNVILLGVKQA